MTLTATKLLQEEALDEALESPRCFCGNEKKMQRALCLNCFNLLPACSRAFLYNTDSDTYLAAIEWLQSHGEKRQC